VSDLPPFDPNGYRKQVLAVVEKRGGPDTSDPFELYDLPLELELSGELSAADVAARIDEVWGFWQRQRDHPKYRVLVGLLVESHEARSAELRDAQRRHTAALRVRQQREQRDAARFELLDAAIRRLVDRYGGVPRDKIAGLDEVGALTGLAPAEVAGRVRRHRIVDAAGPVAAAEPAIGPERRRQVRSLLDEFGRLTDAPPPPTLIALLALTPESPDAEIAATAAAWRARARELPPDRLRAVLDELLVHVAELIEPGHAAVEAYLDTVVLDVREHLMPRVRAAVLVEDRLVAEDHEHLVEEAVARGLDRRRAIDLLAALAAELGTTIEQASSSRTRPEPARSRPPSWEEPLKAARAALRAGRPVEAERLVAEARRRAGSSGATPVRAVADEVEAVLDEARVRARAATAAVDARRFVEALDHLDHLARTASDLGQPADADALRRRARAAVDEADRAVAAAEAGPAGQRTAALEAVIATCADHAGALAALARVPVGAPAWVNAVRDARGDVLVIWAPSDTPGVVYRVRRRGSDGYWRVLGRVPDTSIEDGGAPPGVEPPVYAVSAVQGSRASDETRSDGSAAGSSPTVAPAPPVGDPAAPSGVVAARVSGGTVRVSWIAAAGDSGATEYRVRCLRADGSWRVVGRTRATAIEDGGAPPGLISVYGVSAAVQGGPRSAEVLSEPN
jgi:hypothetical protein